MDYRNCDIDFLIELRRDKAMFHLMAYNKDQDRYDEWQSGTLQEVQAEALFCRNLLRSDDLRDASGDLYDWMEIWDDEDDNGTRDIIITCDEIKTDAVI